MKSDNYRTGKNAESLATKALIKKGYEILENNFRNKFGEIDIIAKDKDTLVFVEVKAKTGEEFGQPEEMINPGKLRKVRNMALIYLKGKYDSIKIPTPSNTMRTICYKKGFIEKEEFFPEPFNEIGTVLYWQKKKAKKQ